MPSLRSSPVSGSQPGCEDRESTLHKVVPHRLCFDHHHKTLLFNRSLDHLHLSMPHRQTILCNRYQSHRMKSDVRHTVHLQVRPGSERNRRHLVPRISIDLQVRLDDHQLFPSSWVYSPIKIISNYPNDVKTSGLRPSSSSSTYCRISYSEWDKPGLNN